jgi:glucokinase
MGKLGGIDLGGTKIQAAVMDETHTAIGTARCPTPASEGPEATAKAMAQMLTDAATAAGIKVSDLDGVGIGTPGEMEGDGVVANVVNIVDWSGPFPLAEKVGTALGGVDVLVGNDVDVATWGEFKLGAGQPYDSVLGVFWGTGVGGGLVLNGERWRGRGSAGEIGHMVVEIDGRTCGCGRKGCLEAYAGRRSMEAHARHLVDKGHHTKLFDIAEEKGKDHLTSGVFAKAVRKHDKMAGKLIDEALHMLAVTMASAGNLLDVDAVILGGGMGTRFGNDHLEELKTLMRPHEFAVEPPVVLVAGLGDLGGAVGASLLFVEDDDAAAAPAA